MSDEKIIALHAEESAGEKFVFKLFQNRNKILYSILFIFLAISLVLKFLPEKKEQYKDYQVAETAFYEITSSKSIDSQLFDQLVQTINKHPELASKYSSNLRQKFIALSQGAEFPSEIEPIQNQIIGAYFKEFSDTTITIVNSEYQKAYTEAEALKRRVLDDLNFSDSKAGKVLLAFNYLRLASLAKKLQSPQKELDNYKNLKQLVLINNEINPELREFVEHFLQNGVSLTDFISVRETALSKS